MNASASASAENRPDPLVRIAARVLGQLLPVAVLASAVAAVVGWMLARHGLPGRQASFLPMPDAIVLACLSAAVLALRMRRGGQVARTLASAALASCAFLMVAYLTRGVAGAPVRMPPTSPAVACACILLCIGLLYATARSQTGFTHRARQAWATAAGWVALWGWAEPAVMRPGESLPLQDLQAPSALLLLALSAALALPGWRKPLNTDLRRIDTLAAWAPALLAAAMFALWLQFEDSEWRERATDTALASRAAAFRLETRLSDRGDAFHRLAERWDTYDGMTERQWKLEAAAYLRDFPAITGLVFVRPDLTIRWRANRLAGPDVVGDPLLPGAGTRELFDAARQARSVRLSSLIHLPSGSDGVTFVAPVFRSGQLEGYMAAAIQLRALLQLAQAPGSEGFGLQVREGATLIAANEARSPSLPASLVRSMDIRVLGRHWTLDAWPTRTYLVRQRSWLPEAVFVLVSAAVGLVAFALLALRRTVLSRQQAKALSARLTSTLESITDALVTLDRQWRFTYLNPEAERLLARSRQELLGRHVWTEFPQAQGTAFQRGYERAVETGEVVGFEEYFEPLAKWFSVRAYPGPEGLAVYFLDSTASRAQREALRESERELRALAESMPQIVWTLRPAAGLIYLNQRWQHFTGRSVAQGLGEGWLEAVHPDDLQRMRSAWKDARSGRSSYGVELRFRRADGHYRWMLVRAEPYSDPVGHIVKWMGTCTDIHDIRQATEALRTSEERFRLLARATNDAILDVDLDTGAIWWSASLQAQFGWEPDVDIRTFEDLLAHVHPDDRSLVRDGAAAVIRSGGTVWEAEFRLLRQDGAIARAAIRGHVIRGESGAASRMLAGLSDVTERTRQEEQLRQSQRLESIGQLTGGIAHDFNNLLTVIIGNAEVLEGELQDRPDLAAMAAVVGQAADRGADLTQRLLAFARRQPLEPVALDVARQLQSLEPLLRRTLGEHIEVELVVPEALDPALADRAQLDTAVLNLCLNARDAMPDGGRLLIEAQHRDLDEDYCRNRVDVRPGAYVAIMVSDTGTGIAPEVLPHLFEPFFTTKGKGKGTGLGLPMVYGFVKQSNGHVAVYSEPGIGTTVTMYFPRAGDNVPAAAWPSQGERPAERSQGECILLVEDDALVLAYAQDLLSALGYRVIATAGGAEALDVLRGPADVDLLFTDVVMAGMSGPQLARAAQELRPGLRVLYTSGYTENGIVHHGRLDPGVQLISKPYHREELARRLRMALADRPSAEPSHPGEESP